MSEVATIAHWIYHSQQAIAFTGAGCSTESGIPDFRSPGGVWANNRTVYFDEFLSSEEDRCEYWRQKCLTHHEFVKASPNATHTVLASWEAQGRLNGVVTQNIDGLHQLAGSQKIFELHGTARQVSCLSCSRHWDADEWVRHYEETKTSPRCPRCAGFLKHATISFGQGLPREALQTSLALAEACDICLSLGSSLVVYPAASVPETAAQHGGRLVIINRDPTPLDSMAAIVINAPLGETMIAIDQELQLLSAN